LGKVKLWTSLLQTLLKELRLSYELDITFEEISKR